MSSNAKAYFAYADRLLQSAEREMDRAEEDVVTQMVVGNARHAVIHYLMAYLEARGTEPEGPAHTEGMLAQCRKMDARFDKLDLSPFAQLDSDPHNAYAYTRAEAENFLAVARLAAEVTREPVTA
jgi:hypothetical protein